MGRGRGRGGRGRGRGRGRGGAGRGEEEEDSSDDEVDQKAEGRTGGQNANAGMLPPSDSESEEEAPAKPAGQPATAGQLPPSSSGSEESSEEDSEDEAPAANGKSAAKPPRPAVPDEPRRRKDAEEEVDPEQARKDMERLQLAKNKREQERLKRIQDEGWDRYAPPSATNVKPDSLPSDHPSRQQQA